MPNIGAVILAAGNSSRLGQPKQLLEFNSKSLLRRAVEAAVNAGCAPATVAVAGEPENTAFSDSIKHELERTGTMVVQNKDWRRGIGTSIRAGVQTVIDTSDAEAIVLLVCDQPFVTARTIEALIALRGKTNKAIIASAYAGTLGVPALFDHSCFAELLELKNDIGAKSIILRNPARVAEFPFPEGELDIDTAEDYEKLRMNL